MMRLVVCAAVLILTRPLCGRCQDPVQADLVLASGLIFDGVSDKPVRGAVAVRGDRIVAVGDFNAAPNTWTLDCTGLHIAPGFIDLHNHSDSQVVRRETRSVANYLTQGCTTIVTGNCGAGPVDVASYGKKIMAAGVGPNVAHLLPQGSLRRQVVGRQAGQATDEQLRQMKELTDQAMRDGAWGMSTGLIYVPGSFADTKELTEIARVVGQYRGIYASHIRNEGTGLLGAVEEALKIGRGADVPVHISHFKSSGREAWGLIRQASAAIEAERTAGRKVTADQYPYIASSTSLSATLAPSWSRAGGKSELIRRHDDPKTRARRRRAHERSLERRDDGARVRIARCRKYPQFVGRRLTEIATAEATTPLEIVVRILKSGGASVVNFSMTEEDVRFAMQKPWVATASDGRSYVPGPDRPHPRSYGTFPRKIGHYARREGIVSEARAIRSSTSLPAEILGMRDRGRITVGSFADIVVYDPETLVDRATFDNPHQHSAGVRHVLVNGRAALMDGRLTGARPGRFLKRPQPENSP